MNNEIANNNEEKKGYPEGTVKTVHTRIETLKMKTDIKTADGRPIGQTGKGVKLTYEDQYGTQILQLPEMKFGVNGMKVQANKDIYAGLQALQGPVKEYLNSDDDDAKAPEITLTFTKGSSYWDLTNLQIGHIGTAGIFDPTKPQGGSGGSYNPEGAIIGKLQNNALELAVKNSSKGDDFDDVVKQATEYLKNADASLYAKFDQAAKEFFRDIANGAGKKEVLPSDEPEVKAKREQKPKPKAAVIESEDDMDDDIPF